MKIVHICVSGEFYEKYAYQDNLLPKYHRKAGHDVTIIASTYSRFDQNTGKVIQDFTRIKYLEDGTKIVRVRPALPLVINRHLHLFFGLDQAVKSEKPDLIFAHGATCPNFLFLSRYKKQHPNVQIVYDNHGDYVNSFHNPLTRWWAKHVEGEIIVKKLLWTSNHYYGTTPVRSQVLHDVYGVPYDKISLLPMGADDDAMQFDKKDNLRKSVREQFGVKEDEFLIVTGGKIDEKKNIHTLVEAVNRINDGKLKILVFGSIVDCIKQRFETLWSDRTIYVGWIPSSDVYKFFYAADLIAFPGLHSAMWEQAVATSVPTAFSKIEGFEHVNVNDNAIMFEQNTVDYYVQVLSELISNPVQYEKLKNNSNCDKIRSFLYSRIAQKVIDDCFVI